MTTLTVKLDEAPVQEAKAIAEARRSTMDDVVADALQLAAEKWKGSGGIVESREERVRRFDEAMAKFSHFETGGPYTRDE